MCSLCENLNFRPRLLDFESSLDKSLVKSASEKAFQALPDLKKQWEKYQSEEEAALGRGKRLRKAVSYREAYAPHPNETLTESGGEEERDPE
ncbi:hypothetical protein JRO89_XS02G0266100 [Xanthoceras sorbifolium]|uniref:DUF1087 domain-containing protein n=1 Tax=Xanthoceras sorbifolium TaxID=99658 RepID=A0ABQ8IH31_9ROSI|nr:hypothetical protein JRO89_XS02G0266100 [Xanthoceras sorbifolium]